MISSSATAKSKRPVQRDSGTAEAPRSFRSKLAQWKKNDVGSTPFAIRLPATEAAATTTPSTTTSTTTTNNSNNNTASTTKVTRKKSKFQRLNEATIKNYRQASQKSFRLNATNNKPQQLMEVFETPTGTNDSKQPSDAITTSAQDSSTKHGSIKTSKSSSSFPVYAKSDTYMKLIIKSLQDNAFLFQNMTYRQCKTLAKAFEPFQVDTGAVVIKQGSRGDYFYIIGSGTVEFHVNSQMVGTAGTGASFGELALLYSCPRAATVIVASDSCNLFRVNKPTFRDMLQTQAHELEQTKLTLLESVPFLQELAKADIKRLGKAMTPKVFEEGDVLPGKAFYLIEDGAIEQIGSDNAVAQVFLASSSFGEQSLATNHSDEFTYKVKTKGLGFFIKRKTFERVLGTFSRLVTKAQNAKTLAGIEAFQKAEVESDEYEELARLVTDEAYPKKTVLFREVQEIDATLYLVLEGCVKLAYNNNVRSGEDRIIRPSEYFGEEHLLRDAEEKRKNIDIGMASSIKTLAKYTATASEDCVLGLLSLSDCRTIFETTLMMGPIVVPQNNLAKSASAESDGGFADGQDESESSTDMDALLAMAPPSLKSQATVDWLKATSSSTMRGDVKLNVKLDDLKRHDILGEGQFGEVWSVTATLAGGNKHSFALKIQKKDDPSRGDSVEVIKREMNVMSLMDHPYIVNLIHHYEDANNLYILMGIVNGGELFNVIHQQGDDGLWYSGIPEDDAKFYALVVADTLEYMHRRHYVFRDLKPENILIEKDGYPVICDFGFAKFVADKTHTLCGTPNYLAPEMVMNEGHGIAVDHWALGIVLYEMVAGENPFYFEGMDQMELFRSIVKEQYFELPKDVSSECEDVIAGLLVKEPTRRLGSLVNRGKDIIRMPWFEQLKLHQVRDKSMKAPFRPENPALEAMLQNSMTLSEHDSVSSSA